MFKSCKECTMRCCSLGPGPYKSLPFTEWFHGGKSYERYNYKCEYFCLETEACLIYNTPQYPVECAIFVCQNKIYTQQELNRIKEYFNVIDGFNQVGALSIIDQESM